MTKKTKNTTPAAEYDGPWKQALLDYFPEAVEFFYPEAYDEIDWKRGYEFLSIEFQQLMGDVELGKRLADLLVKVWLLSGKESFVLFHFEVQGEPEAEFAERMFVYSTRIFNAYRKPVASVGILADETKSWRPTEFSIPIWKNRLSIEFPIVKLSDYLERWQELEKSPNPFAVLVMAHLKTQATRGNASTRLQWKLTLVKGLYQRGYNREQVINLFRLIDWMMTLPKKLERGFKLEIGRYQEEMKMPYITSIERLAREEGIERGLLQGRREALLDILETRFAAVPEELAEAINKIEEPSVLKTLLKQAATADSLAAFTEQLPRDASDN